MGGRAPLRGGRPGREISGAQSGEARLTVVEAMDSLCTC
jgi:hypothetical protein